MTRLKDPFYGSVIDVSDELLARYTDAGYVSADGGSNDTDDSGKPKGNASRDEWAAYADSLDVSYDEDAKREDIKAAIVAAEQRDGEGKGSDPDLDDEADEEDE